LAHRLSKNGSLSGAKVHNYYETSNLLAVFFINPLLFEKKELFLQRKSGKSHPSTKKSQANKGSEVIMPNFSVVP